jgi:kynurenine formamidase
VPDATPDTRYRAHFDAHVEFVNGGSLSTEGFRLDLPGRAVDSDEVARLFVQHLGLALVGSVDLHDLEIVEEPHKGSRGITAEPTTASARRVVDLSHVIREGLVTYPGLPAPTITSHLTREDSRSHYAPGTEFAMDIVTMIGNTGTYLDSPYHRYDGGTDLAGLELASLVDLPAEVFHLTDSGERGIPASVFFDRDVRGKAVLLHTGWDRLFGTPEYGGDAPFLARDGVAYLVEQEAVLVGIDSLNIDEVVPHGERPAHSGLLAAGIHVVEHLTNLGELPASGARFTAVPPKFAGFGTFPVRAYATIG